MSMKFIKMCRYRGDQVFQMNSMNGWRRFLLCFGVWKNKKGAICTTPILEQVCITVKNPYSWKSYLICLLRIVRKLIMLEVKPIMMVQQKSKSRMN